MFVSANRLLRKDIMSESDPLAVVYYYDDAGGGGWREAGRTEIIKNTDSIAPRHPPSAPARPHPLTPRELSPLR